jgi:polyisoprenoid-binding protein YceI
MNFSKNKTLFKASFLALIFLINSPIHSETYHIDQSHSSIRFTIKHLAISNIYGIFKQFEGKFTWDPNDVGSSSLNFNIQATSLNSENKKRDKHLKSPDFFDINQFPSIKFESTRLEKKKHGFEAIGIIEMKGVKKEISLPVTLSEKISNK